MTGREYSSALFCMDGSFGAALDLQRLEEMAVFANTKVFSGFSVDDIPNARQCWRDPGGLGGVGWLWSAT